MDYQIFYPLLDLYGGPILVVIFFALLLLERKHSLRKWTGSWLQRTLTNAAVAIPTLVTLRLVLIPALMAAAWWAQENNFGLLNLVPVPVGLAAIIGFLWLDYVLYGWHWLSHRIPFLWRFHNVHHTDVDLSLTTALRFHFVEMLMSAAFRAGAVALMGVGPWVVLVFEIVFEASVAFHHSNWRLPYRLERVLTWFMVTPRMHGIHHSIVQRETNSNYSNMFNLWDRIHGTIRLNVRQDEISIGVPGYQDPKDMTVLGILLAPFRKQKPYWQKPDGTTPTREEREAPGILAKDR
jgi:sterol desaturase/sphingolipid hydroxylase (fatty acid hydroxylase superfamily)